MTAKNTVSSLAARLDALEALDLPEGLKRIAAIEAVLAELTKPKTRKPGTQSKANQAVTFTDTPTPNWRPHTINHSLMTCLSSATDQTATRTELEEAFTKELEAGTVWTERKPKMLVADWVLAGIKAGWLKDVTPEQPTETADDKADSDTDAK